MWPYVKFESFPLQRYPMKSIVTPSECLPLQLISASSNVSQWKALLHLNAFHYSSIQHHQILANEKHCCIWMPSIIQLASIPRIVTPWYATSVKLVTVNSANNTVPQIDQSLPLLHLESMLQWLSHYIAQVMKQYWYRIKGHYIDTPLI